MMVKLILLGCLQVTSYRPIPAQTKPECRGRFACTTAINDGITMFGIAASQDYIKSGLVHYGDIVYVQDYGYRVVNDTMGPHAANSFDLMVFTYAEEKKIGVRHLKVWLVSSPGENKNQQEAE
jgi:3D (Asp-Asp-Asp) domain-containing protein